MGSSSFYFFLIILIFNLIPIKYADTTTTTTETPPPTYPPSPPQKQQPFKPGISVVIGVLTTMFSLTFLLLLYIKHCNTITSSTTTTQPTSSTTPPRKNSGIDRSVIQSLPIFRFGSLMGQKDGMDCAVCLTRFEPAELLRLLPKCKHAFHVECVDTWLDAHSTCPLCRHHVDPEDILLLHQQHHTKNNNQPQIEEEEEQQQNLGEDLENGRRIAETRRISGRHSSVEGGILRVMKTASFRRSLDSAIGGRKKKENGVVSGRNRKDGMLLVNDEEGVERRLEHRIIVAPCMKVKPQDDDERWSDVQPSDWLYLMSEKIIRQRSNDEGGR